MKIMSGRFSSDQDNTGVIFWLGIALVVMLLFLIVVSYFIGQDSRHDKDYSAYASDLRVLSQEVAKNATEAASGKEEAFAQLKRSREDFEKLLGFIVNGNPDTGLPASNLPVETGVTSRWESVSRNADRILENKETVLTLHQIAATLNETIPQLQIEYEDVVSILLDNDAPADQISVAERQSLRAERIVRSVNNILSGDEDAAIAANRFGEDARLFGRVMNSMFEGNEAMEISQVTDEDAIYGLEAIAELFEYVDSNVQAILENSPELFKVRNAANLIFEDSIALLDETYELSKQVQLQADGRFFSATLAYFILAAIIALIVVIGVLLYQESQKRLRMTEEQNEQNQNAILRLLDELADLADGDLTTEATVTEDFTGAIADSINFAIDQMRGLVKAIRDTAVQVASSASETQGTAMKLAESSENQAQEIAGASAAINEMAVSIDQVSSNAAESATVAERSVTIAKKGSDVVNNTINGMDTIREQIQETSKRIKRLGESSQEIGDIVSLINDIADQTNILSLNAAIQASMAGDAGRGFAVVADEVQRLAERSSAATKQIEALVKTTQTDTNEAVISMEQTTAEVVRGARLAQDAGVALEEIESVSMNLADLIQNISNASRQQSMSAGHVSNTMNVIQEITSQTSSGTSATAESVGNLAEMASQLRASVSGFKLPLDDDESPEQTV
ncbi:chemotaxis protein [Oleiphilus sp. HI0071]|uniref:methyl-accepting chemotaxis protein n=1 Tax=unclassified Oleiphilus TaxID=2631174 RepID=UPI0007C24575|nr:MULTISPECIES: methyl-accepting chemotaxis protein [unclassified Oleiphilus]KZY68156.1 chemotaxis protein [Oleiphilus sp. HI0065]KZY82347.1 chemotaxis protein [Oleiphilus sp. HI0071]KZZ06225.1 chemotaxis protein [Oleiphilus sp. HI0073]KZZ54913.1 chemotaxis protein [Oleiphilus sp. HI0118]KZZ57375.1 chemotaxis protein [Oleiphilus sp. HI0122]KZZ77419.1 chemotaxis protein [Oleiphilus sp. HI0133]KZZ78409.1 chemotaxis protein [Oleiphilus sp. HI0130]